MLSFIIRHTLLLLILYPHFYLLGSIDSLDTEHRNKSFDDFKKSLYYFSIPSYDDLMAYLSGNSTDQDEVEVDDADAIETDSESQSAVVHNLTADLAKTPVNFTDDAKRIIEVRFLLSKHSLTGESYGS